MNRIKTEHAIYDNKAVVKLIFDYDAALVARIRQELPVSRWSRTMRCWYTGAHPQKIAAFQNMGIEGGQKTLPDVIASDDNAGILKRFSDYMRQKRYSSKTTNRYVECLRIFPDFHRSKHYSEIDNTDIAGFNKDYILAKKLSATYQGQFVNAIKLFYEKTPRKKIVIEELERPRTGSPLLHVLSKEDVARPISATADIKHKAILSMIWRYKTINRLEIGHHKISTLSPKIPIMDANREHQ